MAISFHVRGIDAPILSIWGVSRPFTPLMDAGVTDTSVKEDITEFLLAFGDGMASVPERQFWQWAEAGVSGETVAALRAFAAEWRDL